MTQTKKVTDGRQKKRPGIEEQKNSIVKAAVGLFLQYGSRAVSIAQICKAADVSRPTFYRCFADKDELLAELYQFSVNQAVQDIMMEPMRSTENPSSWLKTALDALYDTIFEQPELAALVFRESADPSSPAYKIVSDAFDQLAESLMPFAPKEVPKEKSAAVIKIWFKSIMAANQWIVHDAINKGLSQKDIREAKQAGWLLASKLFDL